MESNIMYKVVGKIIKNAAIIIAFDQFFYNGTLTNGCIDEIKGFINKKSETKEAQ